MLSSSYASSAQVTFKAGWNNYKTGWVIHEYSYNYTNKDSLRLYITDSTKILASTDSLVTLTIDYKLQEKAVYKTARFFNNKKLLLRSEEYKGENLLVTNEWKYDDKNRKAYHYEDNKINGNNYKKSYEYATEKNGELVITESSSFNGRTEFYTKSYYDRNSVKYKEIRLNDNNKDVIHIESYMYGENGKVKQRTVYFPEFKVTKKFNEADGVQLVKCFRSLPLGSLEKINLHTRITFIRKFFTKIQPILLDKECDEFEYTFSNKTNCNVIFRSTHMNGLKQVVFRYREKTL